MPFVKSSLIKCDECRNAVLPGQDSYQVTFTNEVGVELALIGQQASYYHYSCLDPYTILLDLDTDCCMVVKRAEQWTVPD